MLTASSFFHLSLPRCARFVVESIRSVHQLLGEVLFVAWGPSKANVRAHLALIYDISNDLMLTASPFLHLSLPRRSRFVVESIRSVPQLLGEVLFVARRSSEANVRAHLVLIYYILTMIPCSRSHHSFTSPCFGRPVLW